MIPEARSYHEQKVQVQASLMSYSYTHGTELATHVDLRTPTFNRHPPRAEAE